EAVGELAQLRTLSQQSILQKIKDLDETGTRARTVAMVITGTALLFGIALSVGITRSITLPLSRMKKKTREIAEGIFEADLDLPSPPEIGALAGAFNTMCVKLKEVDRMKSDFYSLMSHELRTPLTSIREGTNLLLEGLGGEITEKQRELLVIIAEESTRLIDLVSRLLDLSKLESGVLTFNLSRCDLAPLVARSIREVAPLAAAKHIRIESDIEDIPPVCAEAERILQVLRNLIGNALKFTPSGGEVRVAVRRAEGEVEVSVTDTGPGIPEEELGLVFEKFRQASSVSSPRFKGTGLGLAIVRHIVQAHGGRVWAESEVGRGSTFTFVLPA
ncbi:MAG TPA: HAMP domain-containing sensor histidine kinase, partial [Desulfuromonadaceae bacterium]